MAPRANQEVETLKERIGTLEVRLQSELLALRESVARTQTNEIHLATAPVVERLDKSQAELVERMDRLEGAMKSADSLVKKVTKETTEDRLKQLITGIVEVQTSPLLATLESTVRAALDERLLRSEAAEQAQQEKEALDELSKSLDARASEAAKEAIKSLGERLQEVEVRGSPAGNAVAAEEVAAKHSESVKRDLKQELARLEEVIADNKTKAEEATARLSTTVESQYTSIKGSLEEQNLGEIQESLAQVKTLRDAVSKQLALAEELEHKVGRRVDNMFVRSVCWRIRGFREKLSRMLLDLMSEGNTSRIRSPEFSLCAQPELVLELEAGADVVPNVRSPLQPKVPVPGACALRVWAMPGLVMTFRLRLGTGASAVSRRFEHRFREDPDGSQTDSAGRTCFLVQNFCLLDQAWDKPSNTMDVTFEMLELKVTSESEPSQALEEAPQNPAPEAEAAAPGDPPQAQEAELTQRKPLAGATGAMYADQILKQHVHDPRTTIDPREKLEDQMSFTQLASSETLLLERFREDLQAIRNRAVRRVEWRVQGVARLLDLCKIGEAVDSPAFSAAGVEGLRFHFYPRGHDRESGSNTQFCALYLSAPARTSVRGALYVGSHARQFEQYYQVPGEYGGKGKFCILDTQKDVQDGVTLSLEIFEAEVETPDSNFNLCVRRVHGGNSDGTNGSNRSGGDGSPNMAMPLPLSGVKGSMRMRRGDPAGAEDLLRTISLPSLNTQKFYLPQLSGKTNLLSGSGSR